MNASSPRYLILIIDENENAHGGLLNILGPHKFGVITASDGEAGLEKYEEYHPGIVIVSCEVPGLDGFQVVRKIKEKPRGIFTSVIMNTSLEDASLIEQAFNAGANDFVTESVTELHLAYRIRYLLRSSDALHELKKNRMRLLNAQKIAGLGHWEWTIKDKQLFWCDEVYAILDQDKQSDVKSHLQVIESVHENDKGWVQYAIENSLNKQTSYDLEYRIVTQEGKIRYVHELAEVINDDTGAPESIMGTLQDITARKNAEEEVQRLAYYDSLTNLPNRVMFKEHLKMAILGAARNNEKFALLFFDLDDFKKINDTFGHNAGDELLQGASQRLLSCLRDNDQVSSSGTHGAKDQPLSRLGGDEFTVLLLGNISHEGAAKVSNRIVKAIGEPFEIEGKEVTVGVSIGIAVYPDDGDDVDTLIKNADTAMYHAKTQGKNNFQYYNKTMNEKTMRILTLESEMRKAIENNQFELYYQPKYNIKDRQLDGFEALIRWNHPEEGIITPDVFIPIAEKCNLILPIGAWVLETACKEAIKWSQMGYEDIHVAVNLSAKQFAEENFVDKVKDVLNKTQLDPKRLQLELTEGILMESDVKTLDILRGLKYLGVTISVDDFGTGYSSLRYLGQFPLDTVKIDRSFVNDMLTDENSATITHAIIHLAHGLKLSTVAEGVETEEQLRALDDYGCDGVQGYLFSRPVTSDQLVSLIQK